MPKEISEAFDKRFGLSKDEIIDKVYKQPNPNVFIASFMPFVIDWKNNPFVGEFIVNGLKHFLEVHVCCYENYENTSVHFVGSLSALLKVELDIAAKEMGIEINSIVQKPVGPLVDYHIKYLLNKQLVD